MPRSCRSSTEWLYSIKVPAGAPGIRLIVEADEVETTLGGLDLQRCPAWELRQPLLEKLLSSVSDQVHAKARKNRLDNVLFQPVTMPSFSAGWITLLKWAIVISPFFLIAWTGDTYDPHHPHHHPLTLGERFFFAGVLALFAAAKLFG